MIYGAWFALPSGRGQTSQDLAGSVLRDGGTSDEEDSEFESSSQGAHFASVEQD
jgi:hypothetical protein